MIDYAKAREDSESLYFRFRNYTDLSQSEIDELIDAKVKSPATFMLLEELRGHKHLLDFSKRFLDSSIRSRLIALVLIAHGYSKADAIQLMKDADDEMDSLADASIM